MECRAFLPGGLYWRVSWLLHRRISTQEKQRKVRASERGWTRFSHTVLNLLWDFYSKLISYDVFK